MTDKEKALEEMCRKLDDAGLVKLPVDVDKELDANELLETLPDDLRSEIEFVVSICRELGVEITAADVSIDIYGDDSPTAYYEISPGIKVSSGFRV